MALIPLILMGDWCSEDIADTVIQRKYGKGMEALNQAVGNARSSLCKEKNIFSCPGDVFPLTEGLLMGDPNHI